MQKKPKQKTKPPLIQKLESMTHNEEKNQSVRANPEIMQMIVNKDMKSL